MSSSSQPPDAPPTSCAQRVEWLIVILMMLMSAGLSFRVFFPHLRDIVIFDESYYINKGQDLLHGTLPVFAENPLVNGFWALVSLPFQASPSWMMHAYGLGRFAVFVLLWAGVYEVARAAKGVVPSLAPAGFLLVTPSLLGLLDNSTDGLFAALSALALGRFVRFLRGGTTANGVQASLLLGLAALARNDGIVLIAVAGVLAFVLPARGNDRARRVAATVLPALCLVVGYAAAQALSAGSINLGVARRSYDAFEQGEGVAHYMGRGDHNPYVEGYGKARELYGTPEENSYSIVRAIMRNPSAFAGRVSSAVGQMPAQAMAAYGRGLRGVGAVLFLLALRGVVALWRRRERALLLVIAVWCTHLAVYLLTFYREGYFLLVYAPVFFLASAGASALFERGSLRRELRCAVGGLGLVIVYGIASGNDLLWWPGIVFLMGMLALWSLLNRWHRILSHEVHAAAGVAGIVLLFALQVQFSRPARLSLPSLPQLGSNADEMAARFLAQTQQEGTPVASYTMAPIVLARMYYVAPHIDGRWIETEQDFLAWVARRNVHVFYVDRNFRTCEPRLWEIMRGLMGTDLRVGFHAEDDYETVDVLFH